jgi:pimeloyl-ACP methyl ester carboxylesterase
MYLLKIHIYTTGADIHYYRAGAGEPLLYLHHLLGIVGWEPALARLAESFEVIAPYAPGWGPAKDDLAQIEGGPLDLALHNVDLLDALDPGGEDRGLFSDPALRESLVIREGEEIEGLVSEMLNLRASAKFLWPIPDTGVARRLARVRSPTLIVTSEKDTIIPAEYGSAWQKGIAGAELARFPAAGHLAELEDPDGFARYVTEFVANHKVPTS